MGANTATAKVWYPDTTDSAKLDTILALLASSIENGLGARMTLQETQIGIKAGLASAMNLTNAWATAPFSVGTGNGQYATGVTISGGGVVTVATPGLYMVTGAVSSASTTAGHSLKIQLLQNATQIAYSEQALASNVVTPSFAVPLNCVNGDTISLQAADGNAAGGTTTQSGGATNYFTVALIKATKT